MKITYINANGQEIEFSAESKYSWTNVDDILGNDLLTQTTVSPYQDGATPVGESFYQSKIVQIEFIIKAEDVQSEFRSMCQILNPKLGVGKLQITVDDTYSWDVVKVRTMPKMVWSNDNRGNKFQKSVVMFEVYNPLFVDVTETEIPATSSQNLFVFPLSITEEYVFDVYYPEGAVITNSGDVETPVTIYIDGASTYPIEIINNTVGKKIVVDKSVGANEQLIITTAIDNINVVLKDLVTGEESPAFQYIDVDETEFWQLAVGDNSIQITATEGSVETARIKYKNRYVSI